MSTALMNMIGDDRLTYTLVLNSNNVTGTLNSQYEYNFLSGTFQVKKGAKLTIKSISIPYSWFNVDNAQYNNNVFQYTFTDGSGTTTRTITMLDGNYTVDDINNQILADMTEQGFYLVDSGGNNVYYLNLSVNSTYYANELISLAFPTALPSGYTNPNSLTFPATASTPQLIVPSDNNFGTLIGFSAGSYPSTVQATDYSVLSDLTPVIAPVNNIVVLCDLVDNRVTNPTTIIDSFPIDVSFGNNINYEPAWASFVPLSQGRYSKMTITFVDQNFQQIQMNDDNVCITLIIEQ